MVSIKQFASSQRFERVVLLALLGVAVAAFGLIATAPKTKAQTVVTPLISSDTNTGLVMRYIELGDYVNYRSQVSWPVRGTGANAVDGCGPAGANATTFKTMPWLAGTANMGPVPATIPLHLGNTMIFPDPVQGILPSYGDCVNRYRDGGGNQVVSGASVGKGWLSPFALGGWAQPAPGSSGFTGNVSQIYETPGSSIMNACAGYRPIWGLPSYPGSVRHSERLFRGNGYGTYTDDTWSLFSAGTVIIRHSFNLTQEQLDIINSPDNSLQIRAQADDFFQVYLNGASVRVQPRSGVVLAGDLNLYKSLLRVGQNVLAIQAIDKAIWATDGNQLTAWMGICYGLEAIIADVCPNLAGNQPALPPGYFMSGGNCIVDVCPNITGGQATVPAGYFVDGSGNCIQDVCPNIDGVQTSVPPGYFLVGGQCVQDVCPNIDGIQTSIPAGHIMVGANCMPDVCPNITGAQATIPAGHRIIGGNCVIAAVDCVSAVFNPSSIQAGQPFTMTVTVSNTSTVASATSISRPDASLSISISGAAISPYSNSDAQYSPNPIAGGATATFTTPPITPTGLGAVSGTVTFTSSLWGSDSCAVPSVRVANRPFIKVGGEAAVGGGFNNGAVSCTTPAGVGRVSAFAEASGSFYRGSSADFALYAIGAVQDFYSSAAKTDNQPPPRALTFANNDITQAYGGNLGGSHCITDYYSTTKKAVPGALGSSTSIAAAVAAGNSTGNQLERTGDLTLSGGTLSAGQKLAIYVTGDVYITGPTITLASNFSSPAQIPYFALIVKGNIFISSSVTTLDGIYVAQPGGGVGGGGGIYTCTSGINSFYATGGLSQLHSSCQNRLTFNGMVVAKKIKLLRTGGNISSPASPSEVFNLLPELYLGTAPFRTDPNEGNLYDSITNLPPFL